MSDKNTENVALTTEQLQSLISAAVTAAVVEAKKPYLSEKDIKDIEHRQDERKQSADTQKQMAAQKAHDQKVCSHMRRDNTCRVVYVENGNFLICQKCQLIIRPDNPEFNRLFQLSQPPIFG